MMEKTTRTNFDPSTKGVYCIQSTKKNEPSFIYCNSLGDFQPPSDEDAQAKAKLNANSDNSEATVSTGPKGGGGQVLLSPCPISNNANDAVLVTSSSTTTTTKSIPSKSAKEINETLNLNLGMPIDPKSIPGLEKLCKGLSFLLSLVEARFFSSYDSIPLRLRQKLTIISWSIYFPLHKFLLSNKTAIHKNASYEYHALTSVMYWGKFFPVSIRRIRFSLSQLNALHPPESYPLTVPKRIAMKGSNANSSSTSTSTSTSDNEKKEDLLNINGAYIRTKTMKEGELLSALLFEVNYNMNGSIELSSRKMEREEDGFVNGYYIQHGEIPSKKVIMYLYGGAFLGGDSRGNLNFAEKFGQQCQYTDVFLPDYRLIPEYFFLDALHDIIIAYEYLVKVRGVHPDDIILFGLSSGGGLQTRLMQTLAENNQPMPSGAVLMSPFVDYTEPKGSFVEYRNHDLIVNESVCDEGVPYFETAGDHEERREISPVYRSCQGLPPLCVIFSEHECVTDQVHMLCNNARAAGVKVDIGLWRYLCHVWPMFTPFLPEARQAVDFMCDWVNHHCI